jgi:hypothetical protein
MDEALRFVLKQPSCLWISFTKGDNLYGPEVVSQVLRSLKSLAELPSPNTYTTTAAATTAQETQQMREKREEEEVDLILAPIDSKYFAEKGTNNLC